MSDRMTAAEAVIAIYMVFGAIPDASSAGKTEAFVADWPADRAQLDMESYVAAMDRRIDMTTITITADQIEGSTLDAFHIAILTEETE